MKQIAALPAYLLGHHGPDELFDASDAKDRSEFSRGRQFLAQDPEQAIRLITYGRWACLPFGLIGLLVSMQWVYELYGRLAGYLAAALWIASPTVLGHMPLITADGAATSFGLLASYAFWHFLRDSTWLNTWFVGFALGICLLTKTFWIILFVLWPVMLICWLVSNGRGEIPGLTRAQTWLKVWSRLAAVMGLGLATLNLGYAFSDVGMPLGDFKFHSFTLSGQPLERLTSGNRFQNSLIPFYSPSP
ncbi:MAG: phospholipid carrier-dependent glycosyltransferase, partial [Opitutaceae bacterium]|nr:phospholipid carrier-dependent glycosyltransferase [Verrucomicrobiales bacterium]